VTPQGRGNTWYLKVINIILFKENIMEDIKPVSGNVEIKVSKTDLPVPVINHVHLHSIYNPEREAEGFVSANEPTITRNNNILLFGLGFGYHIAKLESKMKALYPSKYNIFVIEPNRELYEKWKSMRPNQFSSRVKVVCYSSIKGFYKDKELVEFLSDKPGILPHQASFQLNEEFFKAFMSYHYPSSLKESYDFIESERFKDYLMMSDSNITTDEFFQATKSKPFVQGYDFLSLALAEMVQE